MAVLKSFSVFRKETLPYLTKIDYNKNCYRDRKTGAAAFPRRAGRK